MNLVVDDDIGTDVVVRTRKGGNRPLLTVCSVCCFKDDDTRSASECLPKIYGNTRDINNKEDDRMLYLISVHTSRGRLLAMVMIVLGLKWTMNMMSRHA